MARGMSMAGRVDGRVAFITGAARGQGRSHAVRLAEEGADIIALDACAAIDSASYPMPTSEDLAETVRLVQALDRRIVAGRVDVRDFEALKQLVDDGVAELGRLDIVVANAGIANPTVVDEISQRAWHDMIDINLTGVWNTVKVSLRHLRSGGRGGSIVLTSSVAGLEGDVGHAHYIAAKHGVTGLMRALALELAPDRIRVNSLHPTNVNTGMILNDSMMRLFRPDQEHVTIEEFAAAAEEMQALPIPWVEADDVSNALLFLVSEDGRYITGVALPVDGGRIAK